MSRPLRPVEVKRLNREWRRRLDGRLALVLVDVTSPYNVGSIIRSAAAFRADQVWFSGRTPLPHEPGVGKAAMGTDRYLQWDTADDPLSAAREDGYRIVVLEQAEGARPLHEATLAGDTCLVVGNEDKGLPPTILQAADHAAFIPLPGKVGSLNVAVACGIALSAVRTAQWAATGE